ncbi:MAG: alpha-L-fucosidase [Proteobacteria bacterium]|nr:alpha-L-fucosidase [Pseudomonadota bacterium]
MATYEPDWDSLRKHQTPRWLRDDKFGIYTHWGLYSVPACGPNGTWYAHNMYRDGNNQAEYHEKTFGPASTFGYKDFIPMFKAEKFDADEWAEIFKSSGARFAGPVAEHHDGFSMWDSKVNRWNSARMGPMRDITGELERAYRAQGLRFMVALHHAEQWWFYPHWRSDCDVSNPEYAGLYGPLHNLDGLAQGTVAGWQDWTAQDRPTRAFLETWRQKIDELIQGYRPDLIWFDFGIRFLQEDYKKRFLADYYNLGEQWGKELAVTYKGHDFAPGTALVDYELGRMDELTYYDWITDTSVDDQGAWSFVSDAGFKKVSSLVHNLIDNVSKNGYLLLNVGPRADGSIPDGARKCLEGVGQWLKVNGEAIFETTPWVSYGEGPTEMKSAGTFSERKEVEYTPDDIRFTCRNNLLYATVLGWPGQTATIPFNQDRTSSFTTIKRLEPGEIKSVRMLGVDRELNWSWTPQGLSIETPGKKPCEHAYVFRITRQDPFR